MDIISLRYTLQDFQYRISSSRIWGVNPDVPPLHPLVAIFFTFVLKCDMSRIKKKLFLFILVTIYLQLKYLLS